MLLHLHHMLLFYAYLYAYVYASVLATVPYQYSRHM